MPTDTIYGIHADSLNGKAISRVRKIKMIKAPKPFILLAASFRMASAYADISSRQHAYLKKIWPGPYSVILKAKPDKICFGRKKIESVSIRIPKNENLRKIIRKLGRPIVSTSVNIHGKKPLAGLGEVEVYFPKAKPDLIIDAGILKGRKASAIVDLRDGRKPVIIR